MSYNVYQFRSFKDLMKFLDSEIARLSNQYEGLNQRYQVLRTRAERIRRLEKALEELVGEKVGTLNEIDFMGLKVVISARAIDELNVLEETLTSARDMLSALRRVREVINKLASALAGTQATGEEEITIIVQTLNNIPVRILLKETE